MARRSRNLAGLAALGALGVMASRGLYKKPGEELAPVEYRGTDRPPEMPRASVESRPSTVRGDMSAADLYADAAAREALAFPDEDFPRAGRTLAAPVRNQPQETFMGFDYTGPYAEHYPINREKAIAPYVEAAKLAHELGLGINAGHDLSLENLAYFKEKIPHLAEVSIGHALISDALYLGLENTIQLYLKRLV